MQSALFALPEIKSEMLAVIVATKFVRKFRFARNDVVNPTQILVTQRAQATSDLSWIFHLRSREPEGINKRNTPKSFPLFAKVPEIVIATVLPSEANRLVTNQQPRGLVGNRRCRCDARVQFQLREQAA